MTVSTTDSVVEYVSGGPAFPIPYRFLQDSDIEVVLVDQDGVSETLVLGTQYTLTGAGSQNGGTLTSAYAAGILATPGAVLTISRVMDAVQPTDLRNQGRFLAETHENVFDRLTMLIQQGFAWTRRALLRPIGKDYYDAEGRRIANVGDPIANADAVNKLWMEQYVGSVVGGSQGPINNAANVFYLFPNGVPHFVQDLANNIDETLGAKGIGWRGRDAGEALDQFRYIETFGSTATPAATTATMQAAINWCAANNVRLRARATEYVVDLSTVSITIPSNFRCDLEGAWIKRATGNTTPHDMWVNADTTNGNTGLDIRNVRFDGQRQADSLSWNTAEHRFCGLRLVKCSGYLEWIRADNTVNGEIQTEGNRGGIMLDRSVDIRATMLFADGTMGSGVFVYQGKNHIVGVSGKNSSGSGFTSYGCDGNEFHHIYSETSGYSGVSVNGVGMRCSYLYGKGAATNYAGVNIGHDGSGNRASLSQIDNVVGENNTGFGVAVVGSPNVTGSNWRCQANSGRNLFIQNSPSINVDKIITRGAVSEDVRIEGAGEHWLEGDFRGAPGNGISLVTSGAILNLGEGTVVAECGSGGGSTGGILANPGARIICRGKLLSNLRYGAVANGTSAFIDLRGATVSGNTAGPVLTTAGGAAQYESTRLSPTDPMSGTLTIPVGATSVVVPNANAADAARIVIMPTDSVSAGAGIPRVSALTVGTGFTATVTTAPGSAATYRYVLL